VLDCLLSFQGEEGIDGAILEFGVYKGRSAMLVAHRVRPGEPFVLVDVAPYVDLPSIREVAPQAVFVECASEAFPETYPGYRELEGACRFIHVDSSHTFETTTAELAMAERLLAPGGLLVLDDFTNLDYPQVAAATYRYLYTSGSGLMIFLIAGVKAYLCRREDFPRYGDYVLRRLMDEMALRAAPGLCLARTDLHPEHRAFHLRPRLPGEDEPYYGMRIYRSFYQEP